MRFSTMLACAATVAILSPPAAHAGLRAVKRNYNKANVLYTEAAENPYPGPGGTPNCATEGTTMTITCPALEGGLCTARICTTSLADPIDTWQAICGGDPVLQENPTTISTGSSSQVD